MRVRHLLMPLLMLLTVAGCSTQPRRPLDTVDHVDLDRYMGTWHVIAHIPDFAENGKMATADEYHRGEDGDIDVTYHFRKSFDEPPETWDGNAWLPDPQDTARWKVRIIWPFVSDYAIIGLDEDYRYVMVGLPSRELLWIMSRDTQMPDAVYRGFVAKARAQGFRVDDLRRVPQSAGDIGKPGYQ